MQDRGWKLSPEGAAVHPEVGVAVIADVHLGYEWARGAGGDALPAHSLAETLTKLASLLGRAPIRRLIVAGDLVESPRPCRRTSEDVRRLLAWLEERGVALTALMGNHDPRRSPALPATVEVAGWTIGHGHRPLSGRRWIFGHHHPVLRAAGVCAPCFLVGPSRIALPAFSANAAGFNVVSESLPEIFREDGLRCVASTGGELLDFGPLSALKEKLRVG
jgi:putative SbcD/Mre11-related phosphoesterase